MEFMYLALTRSSCNTFQYLYHHLLECSLAHPDTGALVEAGALTSNSPAHQQVWAFGHVTVLFGVVHLRRWNYQTSHVIEAVGTGPCYTSLFGVWNYQTSDVIQVVGIGPWYTSFFGVWNYQTSHAIDAVETHSCSFFLRNLKLLKLSALDHVTPSFFGVWNYQTSHVIEAVGIGHVTLLSSESETIKQAMLLKP